MLHHAQCGQRAVAFFRFLLFDEAEEFGGVARAVEEHALGRQPVAPRAAGFLIVAFEILRKIEVHHVAHVRFVDAHAEGDGRADHGHVVAHEPLLVVRALRVVEAGVIGERGDPRLLELLGECFRAAAAGRVHDSALLAARAREREQLLECVIFGHDAVGEVRAVEARDVTRGIAQRERGDDVVAHAAGRGRRQREHRYAWKGSAQLRETAVIGPEIVTPLADAVGFVDCEARHVPGREIAEHVRHREPLGSEVQETIAALVQGAQAPARLLAVEGGVEERRGNARGGQRVDLILHQRDQRRNDHGEARSHDCG